MIKKIAFLCATVSLAVSGCSNDAPTEDSFSSDNARKANELYVQCMQEAGVPVEINDGQTSYSAKTDELAREYDRISQECWADLEAQGLIPQSDTPPTEEEMRSQYTLEEKAYRCIEDLGYKQDPWPSYEAYKEQILHPNDSQDSSYGVPYFKTVTENTVMPTDEEINACWQQAESE